jgi:hypothetical protein
MPLTLTPYPIAAGAELDVNKEQQLPALKIGITEEEVAPPNTFLHGFVEKAIMVSCNKLER